MDQKSGKSLEQVMADLNAMLLQHHKADATGPMTGPPPAMRRFYLGEGRALPWLLALAAVALAGFFSSFYQVETSEQAVVTRFGAFHQLVGEGPHFKLPFGLDRVYLVEVTRIHEEQFGFRPGHESLSELQERQESLMLTGDLKVAVVEWTLQYKIKDPRKFLFEAAQVKKNIRDMSVSVMRRVVGDKLVSDVLTTDRMLIAEEAKRLTQETLDRFDMGISLVNLKLQNVTPPESVRAAFHEVNIARQEKDQLINQAKGTYNRLIPEARGKAAKVLAEAEAYAIDVVNRAHGDAEKFAAVLAAYQKAPALTRKRLYLETMESVFSQVQKFIVVDPEVKGFLPVLTSASPAPVPVQTGPVQTAPAQAAPDKGTAVSQAAAEARR